MGAVAGEPAEDDSVRGGRRGVSRRLGIVRGHQRSGPGPEARRLTGSGRRRDPSEPPAAMGRDGKTPCCS